MAIVKNVLAEHEDRVAAITVIGVEVQALVLDEASDEVVSNGDPEAGPQVGRRAKSALCHQETKQRFVGGYQTGPKERFNKMQSKVLVGPFSVAQ